MKCLCYTLILLFLLPLRAEARHAQPRDRYLNQWIQIDTLLSLRRPDSAFAVARAVYGTATERKQELYQLKARMYMSLCRQRKEGMIEDSLGTVAARASVRTHFPVSNIWHCVAATTYWRLFHDRFEIRSRPYIRKPYDSLLMRDWSTAHYMNAITMHFRRALSYPDQLAALPAGSYAPVLLPGFRVDSLRFSLLDIIAFDALEFFSNELSSVHNPLDLAPETDSTLFAPASVFTHAALANPDSTSVYPLTLSIYQSILQRHLRDRNPATRIFIDLRRLEYAYQISKLQNSRHYYRMALQALIARYPDRQDIATARYRLAVLEYEEGIITLAAFRDTLLQISRQFPNRKAV